MKLLSKLMPKQFASSLPEVDLQALKYKNIKGIIIDLDNTLVLWNTDKLSPQAKLWLEAAKSYGFKLCIISNSGERRRYHKLSQQELLGAVPIVANAAKPFRRGFLRALRILKLKPQECAMIGDQIFTDVLGGNLLGLYTILVKPVNPKEFILTRLISRNLERLLVYFLKI